MKKRFSMLLLVCVFALTSTVRANPNYYDVGPPPVPQIKKAYADYLKASDVAVNYLQTPLFTDVRCRHENVKATPVKVTSQYAELAGSTTLRRPVIKYASAWNTYRSKISKRKSGIMRPPLILILAT